MDIKRYIVVQAIQTRENELIPIWDDRIIFEKTEMYGNTIRLKDSYGDYFSLIECVYDMKKKILSLGIELDHYPNEADLAYKKGETVYYEKSNRVLAEAVVSDIIFEEFDLIIQKGKKIDTWWVNRFKDVSIVDEEIYAIKNWKPYYLLDNGKTIKWEHELNHKYNG